MKNLLNNLDSFITDVVERYNNEVSPTYDTGVYNVGTGDKTLSEIFPDIPSINPPSGIPKDTRMYLNKLFIFLS